MSSGDYRLEENLPALNFRIDDTGHLDAWVNDVLQPPLDDACSEAARWADQQDPDKAESNTIDAMLADLGNPYRAAEFQPLNRRRLLVRTLVKIYKGRGTEQSIIDVLRAVLGIEVVQIITPAADFSWRLGTDVLGDLASDLPVTDREDTDIAHLGQSPQFQKRSFQIELSVTLTPEVESWATEVVNATKPAQTHFRGFIFPSVPPVIEHWQLNKSALWDLGEPEEPDQTILHDV